MLRMVLCATLLVRRGAGVALRTVASQAKRKNAPAQAQGVFEALDREARPTVRLLDLTEGAPVPYARCTDLQTRLVDECIDGARDALVLVEHPHVYTLGRGATHEKGWVAPATAAVRAPRKIPPPVYVVELEEDEEASAAEAAAEDEIGATPPSHRSRLIASNRTSAYVVELEAGGYS